MPNMSYCQFENTFNDLDDCYEALQNKDFSELSKSEKEYRNKLVEMCKQIAEEFQVELADEIGWGDVNPKEIR